MQINSKFGMLFAHMVDENHLYFHSNYANVDGVDVTIYWYLCKNEAGEWVYDGDGVSFLRSWKKVNYAKIKEELFSLIPLVQKNFLQEKAQQTNYEFIQFWRKFCKLKRSSKTKQLKDEFHKIIIRLKGKQIAWCEFDRIVTGQIIKVRSRSVIVRRFDGEIVTITHENIQLATPDDIMRCQIVR